MVDAIGKARIGRTPAEMEIGLAGMAERPLADLLVEIEQARLVGDLRARLGRHQAARRSRRNRRLLVSGTLAEEAARPRSEEHTSELQSLMRISSAVFSLKKKIQSSSCR